MPALAIGASTVLAALLAAACATDLRERLIPDKIVAALAGVWILWKAACALLFGTTEGITPGLMAALLYGGGLLTFTLVFEAPGKRAGMGGGDIKLMAACALYLGPERSALCLLIACTMSVPLALIVPRTRFACEGERAGTVPFAPAIAAGTLLALLLPAA